MNEMSQMKWRCRRGIKELDIILGKYLEQHYKTAHQNEQKAFRQLLNLEDPVLYSMLLANEEPASPDHTELLHKLKNLFSTE